MKNAKKFIESQLKDLDVPAGSDAWKLIYESAMEAAEIMSRTELKKYIEESLDLLPNSHFLP